MKVSWRCTRLILKKEWPCVFDFVRNIWQCISIVQIEVLQMRGKSLEHIQGKLIDTIQSLLMGKID